MKKKIAFLLVFALLVVSTIPCATAAKGKTITEPLTARYYGIDIENSGEQGPLFNTRVLAECEGGPHIMVAHGFGYIYNVTTNTYVVVNGCCAQCSKCNLVIVTQGEPGTTLGYYTTWQPHEKLTSFVTVIRQTGNNIIYTSSSTIPGIRFRYGYS